MAGLAEPAHQSNAYECAIQSGCRAAACVMLMNRSGTRWCCAGVPLFPSQKESCTSLKQKRTHSHCKLRRASNAQLHGDDFTKHDPRDQLSRLLPVTWSRTKKTPPFSSFLSHNANFSKALFRDEKSRGNQKQLNFDLIVCESNANSLNGLSQRKFGTSCTEDVKLVSRQR